MAKKTIKKAAVKGLAKAKEKKVVRVKQVKVKAKPAPVKAPVKAPAAQRGYNKADLAHFKAIILEKRKQPLDRLVQRRQSVLGQCCTQPGL